MLGNLSEDQFKKLAKYLSYPRGMTLRDKEGYNTYVRARKVNQLMREVGKNNLNLLGMDLANVKNFFASNLSGNAGRYMKTSSLIITFNDLLTTGGHNLSSRISRVNRMTNYKRSRGNYTPKDYERPASTEPATPSTKESSNTPTSKSKTSTNKKTTQSSTPAVKHSSHSSSVRPRSAVISSAPRKTRGL